MRTNEAGIYQSMLAAIFLTTLIIALHVDCPAQNTSTSNNADEYKRLSTEFQSRLNELKMTYLRTTIDMMVGDMRTADNAGRARIVDSAFDVIAHIDPTPDEFANAFLTSAPKLRSDEWYLVVMTLSGTSTATPTPQN